MGEGKDREHSYVDLNKKCYIPPHSIAATVLLNLRHVFLNKAHTNEHPGGFRQQLIEMLEKTFRIQMWIKADLKLGKLRNLIKLFY